MIDVTTRLRRSVSIVAIGLMFLPGIALKDSRAQSPPATQADAAGLSESTRLNASVLKLYSEGKYDEALPLAKRVLEIELSLGRERPDVGAALANLGELYYAKKKDGDAEKLFLEAAAIFDKNQTSSPQVSVVFERLARLSFLNRKYDKAITWLERSLAVRERLYGPNSLQVSETLHEPANKSPKSVNCRSLTRLSSLSRSVRNPRPRNALNYGPHLSIEPRIGRRSFPLPEYPYCQSWLT